MDFLLTMVLVFIGLVLWGVVSVIIIYALAKIDLIFAFVPEGQIVFINKGEDLYDIVANIDGYQLGENGKLKKISKVKSREQPLSDHTARPEESHSWIKKILWSTLGVYFIGIPGYYSVKEFKIKRARLRKHEQKDQDDFAERYIETEDEDKSVKALRWRFPRPVGINSAELGGDGSYISAVVMCLFEVVVPQRPVYELTGDFFDLLESAVKLGFENFCATARFKDGKIVGSDTEDAEKLTYNKFISLDKKHGSDISEMMIEINHRTKAGKDTDRKQANKGIVEKVGIKLVEAYIFGWDAVGETKKLADAQQAGETAKAKAKGVIAEADGRAEAVRRVAEAEGERFQRLILALIEEGVDPDVAAKQIGIFLETENLQKMGNLQTLVQRGGGAMPTVPTNN